MWSKLCQLEPPSFLRGRQLCTLALVFALGILLAWLLKLDPLVALIMAVAVTVIAALAILTARAGARWLLWLSVLALGCFAYSGANTAVQSFPAADGATVQLLGRAAGDSVYRGEERYRVLLQVQAVDGQPWQGRVYLYYEGGALLKGDLLWAEGQVLASSSYGNFARFDYNTYLQRQGIAASVSCYYGGTIALAGEWAAAGSTVRSRLIDAIEQAAGDQAAFIKGVFLGDKTDLGYAERMALSFSGVMHAFAVSGLHVGFLVTAAVFVVGPGRKRRWPRLLLLVALLGFYTDLTGYPASVLRACTMALCLQVAKVLDEKNDTYTSLCLAMLLCLLYRPLWLFDAGFQLSFAASFGIVYLLPLFRQLLHLQNQTQWFWGLFPVTLAAAFATMPLVSYYFYFISLVSWLISPFFILGAALVVLLTLVAALLAIFSAAAAALPLVPAAALARFLSWLTAKASILPFAYLGSGKTPLYAVLVFYAGLLALPWLWRRWRGKRLATAAFLLLLLIFLTCAPLLGQPGDGLLEVVFLDVGQGDAALVITPDGHTILIDGGGRPLSPGTIGEQVLLPYLQARGIRAIDLMISSHPDLDHADGLLTVLENLPVGQLLYAESFADDDLQQRLLTTAQQNGAQLRPVYAGLYFPIEDDLSLTIYNPPQHAVYDENLTNERSLVCLLSYGQIDFLFTGDAGFTEWSEIPAAEVVKLPHHGSRNDGAYDEEAYALLQAEAVVLSVGLNNSYGHPHAVVVEYWQDQAHIYRTDYQGSITFYSDGSSWRAVTYYDEAAQ